MLIISPIQPPMGGISMHVQRLFKLLKNDVEIDLIDYSTNIKKEIYNIRQFSIGKYLKKLKEADLWYIHAGNRSIAKIHVVLSILFQKKTIVTLHGFGNYKAQRFGFLSDFIFRWSDKLILVNQDIFKQKKNLLARSMVLPAFLPPVSDDEPKLPNWLSQYIHAKKLEGNKILVANASKFFHEENDLYGIDILFELANLVLNESLSYLIILVISDLSYKMGINESILSKIDQPCIDKSIKIIHGQISFVRLMDLSDAVLRPTRIDGDSITVREAIYLGKPVFASDIVNRPIGTILFKNNDVFDLKIKIEKYFNSNKPANKDNQSFVENDSFRKEYLSIIEHVIKQRQ